MLNNKIDARAFKNEAYGAFAEVTKALASPRRLELLDLLAQGPHAVEALARGTGQSMAGASQHLQALKRAHLVLTTRRGTTIEYRLAEGVAEAFVALRRLAEARSPQLRHIKDRFYAEADAPETIERTELVRALHDGTAHLIDVRPTDEYDHGHIPGALSVPIDRLDELLGGLPAEGLLVASCRGPYCVYAADAVRRLRARGRRAVRFEDGVADWATDGGTVEGSP